MFDNEYKELNRFKTIADKIDSLDEALFQLNSEKENLDYKINFAKVTISFELEEEADYSILYALLGMFIFGSIIAIIINSAIYIVNERKIDVEAVQKMIQLTVDDYKQIKELIDKYDDDDIEENNVE